MHPPLGHRILALLVTLTASLLLLSTVLAATPAAGDEREEIGVPNSYLVPNAGPDRFGYQFTTSDEGRACRYDWVEPSTPSLQGSAGEIGPTDLRLAFEFPFYGERYTGLLVDPAGLIRFDGGAARLDPEPLGAGPVPLVAPYWDDLRLSALHSEGMAAGGHVITFGGERAGEMLRFQVQLFPDGEVHFLYQRLDGTTADGKGAAVGIQGANSALGVLFRGFPREQRPRAGQAICFHPPTGTSHLSADLRHGFGAAGEEVRYPFQAVNRADEAATLQFEGGGDWPATVRPSHVTIPPHGQVTVELWVTVPSGAPAAHGTQWVVMRDAEGNETRTAVRTTRISGHLGLVGTSTDDRLVPFDLVTSEPLTFSIDALPQGNYPYDVTMHPATGQIWTVGASGDGVVVVDRSSGMEVTRFFLTGEYPVDILFSEHGDLAYSANRDSDSIDLIDTAAYQITGSWPITATGGSGPGKMAIDHCLGTLYGVDWFGDYVRQIDPATGAVLDEFDAGSSLWDLVIDPAAETLYVTDRGTDQVHVIDLATFSLVTSLPTGDDPWGIDITPDGSTLFVANEDSADVTVIDTTGLSVVTTIPLTVPGGDPNVDPRDVEVSEDGTRVYVPSGAVSGDDYVLMIDVATLEQVGQINVAPATNPNALAVRPQFPSLDPIPAFDSSSPVVLGTPIQFTDLTLNDPESWFWDFGDGLGTSTQQNPLYNYGNAGTYTVTLTATNRCGSHMVQAPVTVQSNVTPTPTATPTSTPTPTATPTPTPAARYLPTIRR